MQQNQTKQDSKTKTHYQLERHFTRQLNGMSPFDEVEWKKRDVVIAGNGKDQETKTYKDVEAPVFWEDQAIRMACDKYFMGQGSERETSIRQIVSRVTETIAYGAVQQGLLDAPTGKILEDELSYLLIHQMASFNSPVWFNVGRVKDPQCSACFILDVQDSMDSILEWTKTEGLLFKHGSGAGANLSLLRANGEKLSKGGQASGPVSFMKGADASAGSIRSGGRTRRAAKMVILDADHPDILEFINTKVHEEKKARVLIENGFEGGLEGEVYSNLMFQNANNSIRVTDAFMEAVAADAEWNLIGRKDGQPFKTVKARTVFSAAAQAAWACGDPGIQYHDAINNWHCVPAHGPITGSNPCSEYMFLNNTSCNLASLNLMKFRDFATTDYEAAIEVMALAMETVIDLAGYPTQEIASRTRKFRTLGMGYTNLGALLLSYGVAYDSEAGRLTAASFMNAMTSKVYAVSGRMADIKGAFTGFDLNKESFGIVMKKHQLAHVELRKKVASATSSASTPLELLGGCEAMNTSAAASWNRVLAASGFRNAQATVLAPTGTISFLMGAQTTGIEPFPAFSYRKDLVGGGSVYFLEVKPVAQGLKALGYSESEIEVALKDMEKNGALSNNSLKDSAHRLVFQTAFGNDPLSPEAHIEMMAAVQPFVSGAISKTVNLPSSATVKDIERIFTLGWEKGLKAVAVYRDGSKGIQVLSTKKAEEASAVVAATADVIPTRHRLPQTRQSITHKSSVNGMDVYITAGLHSDGSPGELFILLGKNGSTLQGLMDGFATMWSIARQHGAPVPLLVEKMCGTTFAPNGFTGTDQDELRICTSVLDYIGKWLKATFLDAPLLPLFQAPAAPPKGEQPGKTASPTLSGKFCSNGHLMHQTGSCYSCSTCTESSGGCS